MSPEQRMWLAALAAGSLEVPDDLGLTLRRRCGLPEMATSEYLERVADGVRVLEKYDPASAAPLTEEPR